MGKHLDVATPQRRPSGRGGDASRPHARPFWALPVFAFSAAFSLVAVLLVHPNPVVYSNAAMAPDDWNDRPVQELAVGAEHSQTFERDSYQVTKIVPPRIAAPAAGTPDPGTAQAIARDMVAARGWGAEQYDCLYALWMKESNWNVYAMNKSSGAYGIPQSLPGSKMATVGSDWQTNPVTQITWGLGYITARYGNPCGAWDHSKAKNWY